MRSWWLALLKISLVVLLGISSPSFAASQESSSFNKPTFELSYDDLQRISGELKYIDEVLTSSVLSYIFSGDEKWLERYNVNEPKLTKLIDQLLELKSIEDLTLINDIEKTNLQLVAIEVEAIELAKKNNRKAAMALINDDHYHLLKAQYMEALSTFIENITQRSERQMLLSDDDQDLVLTLEEANWVANNKVTVGVESWPPILSVKNNELHGLSGDVINQITNKAGIEIEIVVGTWNDIFTQFKEGKIDLIPNSYLRESRKQYGQFSKPYFLVKELFYVKASNVSFQEPADLTNATIAIPEGYTTIEKINELFPAINIVTTPNIETSIQLVLSGKVDALLDSTVAVNNYVSHNNIDGLREISEDVIYPNSLHILTNKNHPTLHNIIVKGLDSLKINDVVSSQENWVTTENKVAFKKQSDTIRMLWLSLAALVVLLIVGSFASSIVLKTSDENLAKKFNSPVFRRAILGGLLLLSNVLILTAFLVTKHAENQTFQSLQYNLNTLLTSTHQRLMQWSKYELNHLHSVSKDKQLIELVEELLLLPDDKESLLNSPIQKQIREHVKHKEGNNQGTGFFIISLSNISLASRRDENVGSENLIHKKYPNLLAKVKRGELIFIPPMRSDVELTIDESAVNKQPPPTMFFTVPIVNKRNRIIAILAKRINFDGAFSSILSAGFIGKSGETYAIDKTGTLLSNVRFENDLKKIGLINQDQRASLNLRVAEPDENLVEKEELTQSDPSWPLTFMATQIALQKSGENLTGYNDYRGIQVVGSWLWDETINMGLVAEVDADESFALLNIFKNTIWSVMLISLLLLFGSTLFTLRVGTRATKTLARSHAELEQKVAVRTQELQDNMEYTQSIINNASDGIIVVDNNGQITEFSPASEHIFGYSCAQALEMNIYQLMNTPFHHKYLENKNRKDNTLIELIGVCSDQSLIDIEVAVSEANSDDKDFYTGFVRDTTLRKAAERELKKSKAKAEEATQAKSNFLANMSHEIRTPMNAIIGMSYLALKTELSRKQEDYVNKIHMSAEALLGIINDILDFSKIEAGKLSIENIPFDLNETIDHLVQITSHKSQQKGVELLVDIDPELPMSLVGDPLRLGQILINLTNNSVKFTEHGEIIVRARLKEQQDDEVLVEFSIEDSGIGMTEIQLDSLFQSFSQADASTTRKYGGTGLGLTISKTLTKMMGGEIWVESEYGKGSTFFFTARFPIAETAVNKVLASPESLEQLPVLIVDDSSASRQILSTLSKSLNYKPTVAASGKEAFGLLITAQHNQLPYSLVIADWKMPEMDGISLAAAIANSDEISTKPKFIIVTAYDRDEMLAQATGVKIDDALTKPVNSSSLLDSVMTVMGSCPLHKQRKSTESIENTVGNNIAGSRILLVEDNEINQQIAVELLTMVQVNVDTAWNGEQAIEKIEQNEYDAVLMDIQMPIMDGYTATKLIRKKPNFQSLIIIAMTANAMEGDKEKCIEAGMNDHVAKPIVPEQLFDTISKWIKTENNIDATLKQAEPIRQESADINLQGFDVKSALQRMNGNVSLYRKTMERVAESQKDALKETTEALEEEDFKRAILIVHTLRGIAASIGADFILDTLEKLEVLLTQVNENSAVYDQNEVNHLIKQFTEQHNRLMNTISQWLVETAAKTNKTVKSTSAVIQKQDLISKLNQVYEKLDSYDSSAIDDIENLLEMSLESTTEQQLNELYKVASNYDFDASIEHLNKLLGDLN